jgi:hypothetical protein
MDMAPRREFTSRDDPALLNGALLVDGEADIPRWNGTITRPDAKGEWGAFATSPAGTFPVTGFRSEYAAWRFLVDAGLPESSILTSPPPIEDRNHAEEQEQ